MEPVAVALTMAGWLISSMISKSFSEAVDRWSKHAGLHKEFDSLKKELTKISNLLERGQVPEIRNQSLLQSLKELKLLIHRADDLLDELDYYRLREIVEDQNTNTPNHQAQVSSSSVLSAFRQSGISLPKFRIDRKEKKDLSSRIKALVAQFQQTPSVLQALQLEQLDHIARLIRGTATPQPLATALFTEPKVIGRDEERDRVMQFVTSSDCGHANLSVLSIVGVGGVGKTTLAKYIYNDPKIENDFDVRMWVCVSTNFDVHALTQDMLECVCNDRHVGPMNLSKLQQILKEKLESKRFFLVLDNLWEVQKNDWDDFLAPLKCSQAEGNVVLVTTRIPSAAEMISVIPQINLEGLKEDDFWSFFKSCAFGDEKYEGDRALETIGKEIVARLRGNPLAAKTVGALLRTKQTRRHWIEVRDSDAWKLQKDSSDIMPILRLSYDYLPYYLQQCFSYCSLFPRNSIFKRKRLVRIWMAQGFIDPKDATRTQEDIGVEYFNGLINLGFFELDKWKRYQMHDLIHDLAKEVSNDECFVIDGSEAREAPHTIRHLSIHVYSSGDNFLRELEKVGKEVKVEKLSSLILTRGHTMDFTQNFQSIFKEAKSLRVLILNYFDGCSLLCNFGNFIHLRYLSFYRFDSSLSKEVYKLYHLQALEITDSKPDSTIQEGMNKLVSLRHYKFSGTHHCEIPRVGSLTALQKIRAFRVKKEKDFNIAQLGELRELRSLVINNLEKVEGKEESSRARLVDKKHLRHLRLLWDEERSEIKPIAESDVLEGLQPHQNLEILFIFNYGGTNYPKWLVNNGSLTCLRHLHLENCKSWETLPPLGQLTCLVELFLRFIRGVREIGPAFYGSGRTMGFQFLESLWIHNMPDLQTWVGTDGCELFPRLKFLSINSCFRLSKCTVLESFSSDEVGNKLWLPCLSDLSIHLCPLLTVRLRPLPHTPTLEHISIGKFRGFFRLFSEQCEYEMELQKGKLSISEHIYLQVLDKNLLVFRNLRNVKELHINDCLVLRTLSWEGLSQLVSLESLKVEKCPELLLSPLPYKDQDSNDCFVMQSLKNLVFCKCGVTGKRLSWLLLHLPFLSSLSVTDCPHIVSLALNSLIEKGKTKGEGKMITPENIQQEEGLLEIPSSLTSLKELNISDCLDLIFICNEGLGEIHLEELKISGCPQFFSFVAQHSYVPFLLQFLVKLKVLNVQGCPNFLVAWLSASEELERMGQLFSLPLEEISIDNTGLLTVPICRQLTSLRFLTFLNSHYGMNGPVNFSEENEKALVLLTSLQELRFDKCPNIKSLPAELYRLPSLKKLGILGCPWILSLPEKGLPASLEEVRAPNCRIKLKKQLEKVKHIKCMYFSC